MARTYLWVTALVSLFTKQDPPAEEDVSTYHTPFASPNFQTHEPSSVIFIPQQSGMSKKPLSRIIPPRKEKAAVCHMSISMPIDEPSKSPSTNGEASVSSISKGLMINNPIHQEEKDSRYQIVMNQIIRNLREQELGKFVLGLAIPIVVFLISFANNIFTPLLPIIIIALCLGWVCLFSGLLLRGTIMDMLASQLELFGTVSVLFAFFTVIGLLLPQDLAWIGWASFICCLFLPLSLTVCCVK